MQSLEDTIRKIHSFSRCLTEDLNKLDFVDVHYCQLEELSDSFLECTSISSCECSLLVSVNYYSLNQQSRTSRHFLFESLICVRFIPCGIPLIKGFICGRHQWPLQGRTDSAYRLGHGRKVSWTFPHGYNSGCFKQTHANIRKCN